VLLLWWLFFFRMLGAGDIKLFCALGGLMGPGIIWKCMLVSFLLGAILSLAILTACRGFGCRFRYLFSYLRELPQSSAAKPYCQKGMSFEKIHFAVPVFLSVMLYVGGVY
jgi:prepilin peptidase CpaA